MANPFDQFDAPATGGNPFDQFDAPVSHNAGLTAPPVNINEGTPNERAAPAINTGRNLPPSSFGRAVRIGSQGAGRGAAELLGLPVDLASGALNLGSAGTEKVVNWFRDEGDEVSLPRFGGPVTAPQWVDAILPGVGGKQFAGPPGSSAFIRDLAGDAAADVGMPPIEESDMNLTERTGYNVNRLGAESIATGGALARTALKATPGTIVHSMSAPYREGVSNAATMPGPLRAEIEAAKPLLTDAAAGVGSGAALTAAHEYGPENSPIADMAATMLGGMGGASAVRPMRVPAQVGRAITDRFPDQGVAPDPETGLRVDRRTADQAARFAQKQASSPEDAAASIRQRSQEAIEMGEPQPTSGVASGDIGLIAGERGARLRDPVPFQERDQALKNAAEENITNLRDPDAEPRAAQRFVEKDVAAQRETAQRPVQQARGELEQAQATSAQRLTEAETRREAELTARQQDVTARQAGVRGAEEAERELGGTIAARRTGDVAASERVDEAYGAAKEADEARKSGIYREAETLGRETELDPAPFAESARRIRDEISPLATQDASLNNILRDLDNLAPVEGEVARMTVTDMIEMTPRLSAARDAASRLKRGNVVQRIDEITSGIKGRLGALADAGDPAAVKWREAEENFRTDFAPKYRQGVGAQLDRAERAKTPVDPSKVGGRFLGGGKEAAEDLNRILRNAKSETAGKAAARDYVLADMGKVVGADGKVQPSRLRAWMASREGLFQAMPNLRAEAETVLRDVMNRRNATTELQRDLEKAVGARRNADAKLRKDIAAVKSDNRLTETQKKNKLAEMERKAADVERDIQNSATALLLDSDPKGAAKRVFSQRDPEKAMREIVTKLGKDKEAVAGWKRAVTDHMIRKVTNTNTAMSVGPDGPVSIAALKNFFDDNSSALAAVFSPQEMHALRRAHKMLEPLGNLQRQATAGSPTIENKIMAEKTWGLLEVGFKATYGILKGGGIMRTLKLAAKQLSGDADPVDDLVKRLYFDPELAQHLLTRNVKEIGTPAWNSKLSKLLAAGEGAREISDVETVEDDDGTKRTYGNYPGGFKLLDQESP